MGLPNFSIRRPVTILMFFLGVVLLGFISWDRLPQELFPPITYPQLTVVTVYKDAAPEEIEILVTRLLEEVIGTVSGLRRISSTSKEGVSLIIAEFNWATNMDFAALGVREKIDLVKERLPRGSGDPLVMKFNPFELPVMILNVTSDLAPADLVQLTRKAIKSELEKTDGVASVTMSGGVEREILVEVDQGRLQASGVSVVSIADALKKANLNYPAGTVEEAFYEYLIRTIGELQAVSEIKDIAIGVDERGRQAPARPGVTPKAEEEERLAEKRLILLKDIAKVKDTLKERISISRFDGKDNISLSIIKQAGTNTLHVANNIKATLKQMRLDLPPQVKIDIAYDQSSFIRSSINGVRAAALQGGILAFLVLLLFLRRPVSALIVTLSIPISILAVFSLMYFFGLTLNMISLGGLALGVVMLVDSGIVVIENIFRHRKEGKWPKDASASGANEVNSAIVGSTFIAIAVFFPMVFVTGIAGQLFKELAFTVVFSLLTSMVVASTLIPVLASREKLRLRTRDRSGSGIGERSDRSGNGIGDRSGNETRDRSDHSESGRGIFGRVADVAVIALKGFLAHKFVGLFTVLVIFLVTFKLFVGLDREFLPKVDQGQFIIKVNMSPGTRLAVTDSVVKKIEQTLFQIPDVEDVSASIGSAKEEEKGLSLETLDPHQGQIMVNLKTLASWKRPRARGVQSILALVGARRKELADFRTRSTGDVLQELKSRLEKENLEEGAELEYILQEGIFMSAFQAGAPIVIEVKGERLGILKRISEEVQEKIKPVPGIYGIRTSLVAPAPEAKVNIRKDRAATYNLSVSDIALTAQTAMKGYLATKFKEAGREIDVRVRLRPEDRADINKVRRLIVHSPLGLEVPLAEAAYFSIGKGPSQIQRLEQQRVILVSANIFKRGLNEVIEDINTVLEKMRIPSGYSVELTGENRRINESFRSLMFALILSLVLVYMIMAAVFESLWQPFVILFTFPLSIIGVALALRFTQTPLSIMVLLGIIVLGGIVVNNGIVLIDYANILRRRDRFGPREAVVEASRTRFRPILMTAMTTVLALTPLALGLNEGAEIQVPMAIAVMGGLTIATFLSLVVIPTLYLGFDEFLRFFKVPRVAKAEVTASIQPIPAPKPEEPPPKPEVPPPRPGVYPPKPVVPSPKREEPPPKPEEHPPKAEEPPPKPEEPPPKPEAPPKPVIRLPEKPPEKPGEPVICLPELPLPKEKPLPEERPHIIEMPLPPEVAVPPKPKEPSRPVPTKRRPPKAKVLPKEVSPKPAPPPAIAKPGKMELTDLNERQRKVLEFLLKSLKVTRKDYAEMYDVSIPTAARDLKELVDRGLIRGEGPLARGRYYELI